MINLLSTLRAGAALALLLGAGLVAQAAEVGKPAPAFTLTDSNGKSHSLSEYKGKFVVLEWVNHGCPFVQRQYHQKNMQTLQETYTGKGVVWLSINSTNPQHPDAVTGEKANEQNAKVGGHATAILLDSDGKVGHAYDAKTTPDMFVINPEGTLIYSGGIDSKPSARPDDPVVPSYVAAALDEAMAGKSVSTPVTKSYGCGVKYSGE